MLVEYCAHEHVCPSGLVSLIIAVQFLTWGIETLKQRQRESNLVFYAQSTVLLYQIQDSKIQIVYLTWASSLINIHNTVHKNNVHISLEMFYFAPPPPPSPVDPQNTDHKNFVVLVYILWSCLRYAELGTQIVYLRHFRHNLWCYGNWLNCHYVCICKCGFWSPWLCVGVVVLHLDNIPRASLQRAGGHLEPKMLTGHLSIWFFNLFLDFLYIIDSRFFCCCCCSTVISHTEGGGGGGGTKRQTEKQREGVGEETQAQIDRWRERGVRKGVGGGTETLTQRDRWRETDRESDRESGAGRRRLNKWINFILRWCWIRLRVFIQPAVAQMRD